MIFLSSILEVNRLFGSLNWVPLSTVYAMGDPPLVPFCDHFTCTRVSWMKGHLNYIWQRNGTAAFPKIII